jgi:hypothetical protein
MSRFLGVSFAAGCALFLVAGAASAQYPPGYSNSRAGYNAVNRPLLSPYLSLVNNGNAGINYYTQTLPEINRRATQQLYGAAINSLEARALAPPPPASADADLFAPLPSTGHPVAFQYTGGYFPTPNLRPPTQAYQPQGARR